MIIPCRPFLLMAVLVFLPQPWLVAEGQVQSLSQLRFLAGTWTGMQGATELEEVWSDPQSGTMIGMYREMGGNATSFYEFLVLSEEAGGVVLRMKHFDADFKGREERDQSVTFDLTKGSRGLAVFVSRNAQRPTTLEYRQVATNRLDGILTRIRDGKKTRDEFHYTKKVR